LSPLMWFLVEILINRIDARHRRELLLRHGAGELGSTASAVDSACDRIWGSCDLGGGPWVWSWTSTRTR
jgi:hypothetical protein